ncbi:fimbrial protein [Escherichia coli]
MKIKNAILFSCILYSVGCFSVHASDSTITITGTVLQKTCVTPQDVTVPLGNLYVSDFPTEGSFSQWRDFDLNLTACQNTNNVRITLNGSAQGDKYFANNGNAQGIKIEIQDRDGTNTQYYTGAVKTVVVRGDSANFNFKARAVRDGDVSPGTINSVLTASFTYL